MDEKTDGTRTFQFGSAGEPYVFEPGDADSTAIAFTKAVNDGIESGEEIEGEAAIAVAEVLKATGDLAWPSDGGYQALLTAVQDALPKLPRVNSGPNEPYSYVYVQDIALDAAHALVCGYDLDGDGDSDTYVVPFTVHGTGADLSVIVGDKSTWVEVEQEFVEKAGRMFSGRNLGAMQEAYTVLGNLIAAADKPDKDEHTDETLKGTGNEDMSYTVTKANAAMRYTLGPLYAPARKDAHGEYIEDDTLHKSLHEFVRDSADNGRRINVQHGDKGDLQCGEWVEAVRWPYDHTITMKSADGTSHEVEMPAGTVYLGVVWDEEYWDTAKCAPKGLNGYSLGGRAIKVRGDGETETLKDMGYKVAKSAPTKDEIERSTEIDLAVEVGRAEAEARVHASLSERLLGVLKDHAKSGVTINEHSAPGLEDLVE